MSHNPMSLYNTILVHRNWFNIRDDVMVVGFKFNLYYRKRSDESRWSSVQLEVLDNEYEDCN